jgi:hypothetical protein
MGDVPGFRPSSGRYPLWSVMAALAFIGVLLALGRWLETNLDAVGLSFSGPPKPPTQWAFVSSILIIAMMGAAAGRKGRLRRLLASRESPVWYGGVLLFMAGYFRYATGPWGWSMSQYVLIRWPTSVTDLSFILGSWQMAFGAVFAASSFASIASSRPSAYRWRWSVVGLSLASLATSFIVTTYLVSDRLDPAARTKSYSMMGLTLASLTATAGFASVDRRKAYLMELIAGLLLVPYLVPEGFTINQQSVSLGVAFSKAGPGYWIQALGTILLLIGVSWSLLSPNRAEQRANLARG